MDTGIVSQQVVAELRASLEENRALVDDLKDRIADGIAEIRDEFAVEDATRGTGTMTEAEHEAFIARCDRMKDVHLLATYLGTTALLHVRLTGAEHDLMTHVKTAFLSIAARWLPPDEFGDAFRWVMDEDEADIDLDFSYLDDDA
jgi:hypothetical protein